MAKYFYIISLGGYNGNRSEINDYSNNYLLILWMLMRNFSFLSCFLPSMFSYIANECNLLNQWLVDKHKWNLCSFSLCLTYQTIQTGLSQQWWGYTVSDIRWSGVRPLRKGCYANIDQRPQVPVAGWSRS